MAHQQAHQQARLQLFGAATRRNLSSAAAAGEPRSSRGASSAAAWRQLVVMLRSAYLDAKRTCDATRRPTTGNRKRQTSPLPAAVLR